jgi:hypothetical protein
MKDTILNSLVIAATFSAILFSAIGDLRSAPQPVVAMAAPRVVEMGKTVVVAKGLPSDVTLVASAGR